MEIIVRNHTPIYTKTLPDILYPKKATAATVKIGKGALGVERLNSILQEYLNPKSPDKAEREAGGVIYRVGDKVMQIKNNYQIEWEIRNRYGIPVDGGTGVFNGDIGKIRSINAFAEQLTVEFDEGKMVDYSFRQLEELELAYAITYPYKQY